MRGTVKLRILREGQEYFVSKRQYCLMKEAFATMAIKHFTKHNQRLAMLHFINNKNFNLLRKSFYTMLAQFYQVKSKEQVIIDARIRNIFKKVFYHWYHRKQTKLIERTNLQGFTQMRTSRVMQHFYNEWAMSTQRSKLHVSLKKVAAVIFFQNYLKRHMFAWRRYTLEQRSRRFAYVTVKINR